MNRLLLLAIRGPFRGRAPARLVVKEYRRAKDYQRDARRWDRKGYRVASVVSQAERRGWLLDVFLWPHGPNERLVVTYMLGNGANNGLS